MHSCEAGPSPCIAHCPLYQCQLVTSHRQKCLIENEGKRAEHLHYGQRQGSSMYSLNGPVILCL